MYSQMIRPSFDFGHLCIERWQASRERERETDRERQRQRETERESEISYKLVKGKHIYHSHEEISKGFFLGKLQKLMPQFIFYS